MHLTLNAVYYNQCSNTLWSTSVFTRHLYCCPLVRRVLCVDWHGWHFCCLFSHACCHVCGGVCVRRVFYWLRAIAQWPQRYSWYALPHQTIHTTPRPTIQTTPCQTIYTAPAKPSTPPPAKPSTPPPAKPSTSPTAKSATPPPATPTTPARPPM